MKDYALALAGSKSGYNAKLNVLREYLQAYILRILNEEGFFRCAAFLGGTALRFLHGLPRFSEDLDFSLERKKNYSFETLAQKIKQELTLAGYEISIAFREDRTVQVAAVKFESLLHEAGLSPLKTQKFSVKIEIDTRPPAGASVVTEIVNRYFPIAFLAHNLPSLFAGKLAALFSRKYTKGRDFFDLGWYLSRWKDLVPNLVLLRHALEQTRPGGPMPDEKNWRDFLYRAVEAADWKKVKADVENFLENPSDLKILTQKNLLHLIKA